VAPYSEVARYPCPEQGRDGRMTAGTDMIASEDAISEAPRNRCTCAAGSEHVTERLQKGQTDAIRLFYLQHLWQDHLWDELHRYEPCLGEDCCWCKGVADGEDLLCSHCRDHGGVSYLQREHIEALLEQDTSAEERAKWRATAAGQIQVEITEAAKPFTPM
jgi:hypothetical protein